MVRGQFKSKQRFRKKQVCTPGGKTVIHYLERKPQASSCAGCGRALAGVPRELPSVMQNLPKTAKRPERPFGGMLCSPCMRMMFQLKARGEPQ